MFPQLALALLLLAPSAMVNHAVEGMAQARVGDYVGAMQSFRMARSDQMSKEAYMAWGMAAMKLGKYRSAAAKFAMASGHDPKDGDPLALMGESYLRANDPKEAIASFARIRERPLTDPVGLKIMWGTANNLLGVYAQGLAFFREALREAPSERNPEIVRGEATSLIGLGRYDEALNRLAPYLKTHSDDSLALALVGEVHLKKGAYDHAAQSLKEALRKGAPAGPTAYNLACAESRRGEIEKACAALKRSCAAQFDCATPMKIDPDLSAVRERGCPGL